MAAVTMSSNLDGLSQPPSQASSPSATANTFSPSQLPAPRAIINNLQHVRPQPSLPGTPTTAQQTLMDPPSGMKYHDFLRTWNDNQVSRWLADIKCGHHANTFKASDIRGDVLLELDQDTLKEMGIASIGDRLRVLNAVKTLRQKCSTKSERLSIYGTALSRNGDGMAHRRSGSVTSPTSRLASRKLEHGRPPPLQLTPNANQSANLPHLIREGQSAPDSASRSTMPLRPLPQPNQQPQSNASSTFYTTTPGSSYSTSSRPNILPLPPVPRSQPPLPPTGRPSTRNLHSGPGIPGRRTPTQVEAPEFTSQPLPPAPVNQSLLTPSSNGTWSGYGLPPDPRAGIGSVKTPVRSQSPMLPNVPIRTATRSPNPAPAHGRNVSMSSVQNGSSPLTKVGPRPSTSAHPYSQGLQPPAQPTSVLSPIAESFLSNSATVTVPSTSASPSPPTTYTVGRGPFVRPNTPSYNNTPSLVDLRKKLIKFQLAEEGHSCTLNIEDCAGGIEVLEKALKKFGKLGGKSSDTESAIVGTDDGGLSVDGWGVYVNWGNEDSPGIPLSEAQLLAVCHASPDDPAREHGLTLRRTGKAKRSKALAHIFGEIPPIPGQRNSPTSPLFVGPRLSTGEEDEDGNLLSPGYGNFATSQSQTAKNKRASSISILSGLGVRDPEKALESPSSPTQSSTAGKHSSGSSFSKGPSRLRNFFGQRPPSELITNHLSEYFPFTEKKVLERTARHSMLRAGGSAAFGKRDSTMSFAPPSSRFSVSTLGSQHRSSHRGSIASIPPPVPDKASDRASMITVDEPLRVSLSTDDGHDVGADSDEDNKPLAMLNKRDSKAHLLPPVNISFESFSESMNSLTGGQLGAHRLSARPMSTASRRMSYIKELRSKRDISDTASIMTMDEITAEVESRRESGNNTIADDASWTKVDADSDEDTEAPAAPVDIPPEGDEDEDDTIVEDDVEEEEEEVEEEEEDEDGTGKAITSKGIKWIKGALIGAGSFGKVYLGMDATNGLLMAVKQVDIPSNASTNEARQRSMLDALEREIELLKDLQHEHIVQYLYSSADEEHFNIFLEYVPGGSVTALLRNYGAFEEPLVRNFVRQILDGLDYVHERGIVHRDIKGANVLVDNKGGIKISDFGISKKLQDNIPGTRLHRPSLQGSVFWMAPEVVKQTAYTKKADIWSVGCLVVEMFTGEHPYPQLNQMQAIFKIGSSAKPTIPSDITAEAQNFLELCFELDHEARPSAGDLLRHPWLTKKPGKNSGKSAAKEAAS